MEKISNLDFSKINISDNFDNSDFMKLFNSIPENIVSQDTKLKIKDVTLKSTKAATCGALVGSIIPGVGTVTGLVTGFAIQGSILVASEIKERINK